MLKKKNKTIRCDYCGDEVPYIRKTKKFCCPKCRVYFWRAKQYEMKKKQLEQTTDIETK